jgi:hypothetical protein
MAMIAAGSAACAAVGARVRAPPAQRATRSVAAVRACQPQTGKLQWISTAEDPPAQLGAKIEVVDEQRIVLDGESPTRHPMANGSTRHVAASRSRSALWCLQRPRTYPIAWRARVADVMTSTPDREMSSRGQQSRYRDNRAQASCSRCAETATGVLSSGAKVWTRSSSTSQPKSSSSGSEWPRARSSSRRVR